MNPRTNGTAASNPARQGESRRAPRWIPAFECRGDVRVGESRWEGRILDVSDRGVRLHLSAPERETLEGWNESVRVTFHVGSTRHEREARVVRLESLPEGAVVLALEFDGGPTSSDDPAITLPLESLAIDPRQALRVPGSQAMRRRMLPLCEVDGKVVMACAQIGDQHGLDAFARLLDRPIQPQPVEPAALLRLMMRIHGDQGISNDVAEDDPVALCDRILQTAWLRGASDVHIRPERDFVHVQLRVDGQLEPYGRIARENHPELLSRIKILGGMDIAEKRAPQDGRFTQEFAGGQRVDIRVATLPSNHGERATLRLLAIEAETLTLENLGMSTEDFARCERNLRRPHGLVLATGPTGCGKTTTLYAALRSIIGRRDVNAIALQEPVEYDIPGVTQVEVDSSHKVSFSNALRSIMRHDPDVILIGEIRDLETAGIAIKAALTGHLVLATLHTNSAASVVTRLADMGVERYLIAATLRLAIAQRLVRRLCPHCRLPELLGEERAAQLRVSELASRTVFSPRGCVFCAGAGQRGRMGIFELFEVDEEIARGIRTGLDESELVPLAAAKGMGSLRQDAISKMLQGRTTPRAVMEAVEA